MAAIGMFCIIFSYVYSGTEIANMMDSFRVAGGATIAIVIIAIGLYFVKKNNRNIMDFVSGVLVILIWIFVIIPYCIALPITSLYIPSTS
jgi:membrane protein YdbS with pleckstrin-like domain